MEVQDGVVVTKGQTKSDDQGATVRDKTGVVCRGIRARRMTVDEDAAEGWMSSAWGTPGP